MASAAACTMWIAASIVASASAECGGAQRLIVGQTFLANSLDPLSGSTPWALASHGLAEKLFTVDSTGSVVPQVGKTITKIDDLTWEVELQSNYKFSDGTLVTATNVADALNQVDQQNSNNARASAGAMTWTVVSTNTLRVVSARASPVMKSVLAEWPFVVFIMKSGQAIFTGPFAVDNYVQNVQLDLAPNTQYPGAADRGLITIKKFASGDAVAQALENGELDLGFQLPATRLDALRNIAGLTIKSFEVSYHYMMWHNTRRSPLDDVKVREAVDLVLDRSQLTQTLLGGDPTRSLFPDNTPWGLQAAKHAHADKTKAEQLLTEAGWTLDTSSGSRMKNGAALTLKLVAYPQRPGLVLMQPVIKQALEGVGIVVNSKVTDGSNWNELDTIMAAYDYDLLMWAQNTLPAPDPQRFLNSHFRSDGGSNHAGLNSSTVDGLLDSLASTAVHTQRVAACEAAHNAVLDEVPVSNLMTPSWHVGLSERLSSYVPWGSDYYVIRGTTEADGAFFTRTCTTGTATTTTKEMPAAVSRAAHAGTSRGCWIVAGAVAALGSLSIWA